ncbi:vWA domain-containing protein [Acidianus ambivalens]|uniref:VWA domain-containing protein n=1 Tax=Acidianus ambivalens TaxID=2283 RepID=A0A650CUL4_ACIAM|nr:VWA domain-containing protein [Acidianus ambivalens]MQL55881.1 VWA domain-containing protein [Acidianus ambivalens]QGR21554.1 VWA domain-containing protein [Acidianus ambivalens]
MTGFLIGIDYDDPIVKYRGDRILYTLKKISGKDSNIDPDFLVDTYYVHYLPLPILKSKSEISQGDAIKYALLDMTLSSDLVLKNRNYSIANSAVSMALSVSYIQNLIEELERIRRTSQSAEEREAAEQILNGLMKGSQGKEGGEQKEQQGQTTDATKKLLKQVHEKALSKAAEDANAVRSMQRIVGGNGAGTGSVLNFEGDVHEVLRLARNTEIKKILEFLSGIPKLGSLTKKRTTRYSKGELYGYEEGSDLERIVPSELAMPEDLFYVRLAESQLLLYQKQIKESLGPIYLLLDKSGSMDGEKILWAKAVALALYSRARRENRDFYLRFFDNIPYPLIKVIKNAKSKDVIKMIEYIGKIRGGGGTDISRSVISACEDIKEGHVKGVSEVIILTDGEDKIAETTVRRSLKDANATLISVMIRGDNADLRRISDTYLVVYKLDQNDLLKVVEA